ncbi:9784_t:CDS:10 [Gigaspora rosea]|nr:9784_t:CDS:10 [Gigaspora rosea]
MDGPSEPVNHDDTSVSPSANINENDLNCVVIPEISLRKRKLYTDDTSGDNVSELSSEETLRRQPPDPFCNRELKTASGTKNVFDIMRFQKQKNARITDHNNAPNPCLEVVYINNIQHSVCNIKMVDGKVCDIKVKTGDSTMASWRHLNLEHGYTKYSVQQLSRKQTTITKAFEISLAKPHNTTEQAIRDKAITEVIVAQNFSLSFTEEKMFKHFTKIHDLHQAETVLLTADLWTVYSHKGYLADAIAKSGLKSACNKLGIKWVPCSTHILNLIVQKGLLPAKKLITWMNYLITFFTMPKQSEHLEGVQESIQKQQKSNQEKMIELKPYIEILASSLTVQLERDAIEDRKQLKSIMITEDEWTAVAGIINILKPFSDITNYILDEIDLDTMDDISVFDLEEVSDEDKEFEQIRSLAATTNLVERIKNIMFKLFERYYKFDDDKILFLTMAIDPKCKNFEYEGAILKDQDYLRLEYDQIIRMKVLDHHQVDQYLMMEMIGPLDNPLQWWADHKNSLPKTASIAQKFLEIPLTSVFCERLFSQYGNVMTKKRTQLSPQTFSKLAFCHTNQDRYDTMFLTIN